MGNRINVQNAALVEVIENTETSYEIGTILKLPGLMHIDLSLLFATGELYGDGVLKSKKTKITGAVVKFGVNKVPIEGRELLNGSVLSDEGILDVSTDDKQKMVAFYAETEADDNTKEQLWLLCGNAQPFGLSGKQSEGNVSFSTDEVTIDFVQREKDKKVLRLADTALKKFTEENSKKFALHPDMKTSLPAEGTEQTETTTP